MITRTFKSVRATFHELQWPWVALHGIRIATGAVLPGVLHHAPSDARKHMPFVPP